MSAGTRRERDVLGSDRELIERALQLQCESQVAAARARLLAGTILQLKASRLGLCGRLEEQEQLTEELRLDKELLEREVARRTSALQAANDRLAEEMGERIALEQQLLQAQKVEAIGNLAGGIAHDFDNILTAIQGGIGLALLELPPDEPVREGLNDAEAAVGDAAALTQQLLDLSRKRPATAVQPVELGEVVRRALRLAQPSLPSSIEVPTEIQEGPPTTAGDPYALVQVVLNLVMNARDAMPTGGVLTLRAGSPTRDTCPRIEGGQCLQLEVVDSGTGVSPDVLEHVFEPFYSTKPSGRGTGLGLAMVYRTVRIHGGQVVVQSEPGQGTRFRVLVPVSPAPTEGLPSRSAPIPTGSELILLVDDTESSSSAGVGMLERLGYEVVVAANGHPALEVFERRHEEIAAVLTDLTMPGLSGFELLAELRSRSQEVPVGLVAGYAPGLDEDRVRARGFDAFLNKPFQLLQLGQTVRTLVEAR